MKLEVDKSVWNKMKQRLSKDSMELRVGWFEGDRYGPENDNLPVAQIAKWNEEGTETNPTRPFIRVGFMQPVQKGIYNSYFIESMQKIAEGKSSFSQEYRKLAPMVRKDFQEVIEEWSTPPNSPVTIERKGFNNPLIDTGTMHDSVSWMIASSKSAQGEE